MAGLLATPGCERRARLVGVLDHAAVRLGAPEPHQSPFALARAAQFAGRLARDEHAAVVGLIREHLAIEPGDTVTSTLATALADPEPRLHVVPGPTVIPLPTRRPAPPHAATLQELVSSAKPPATAPPPPSTPTLQEMVLSTARPDTGPELDTGPLLLVSGPTPHLVAVRTYAMVDGQADPSKVAATSREVAVIVAALRAAHPAVSARVLLVLPRNFGLAPTGALLDVTPQLARLGHLRLPEPASPDHVADLPHRFGDGCTECPLFDHCASEQTGLVTRLGDTMTNLCGPGTTVAQALADPPPDHVARLKLTAADQGRAIARATVRHAHLAARPLVVTGLHLAGEPAAVVALRYGTAPDDEKLLVVAEPRDREQRMAVLREFAIDLTEYVSSFSTVEPVVRRDFTVVECSTEAPQLITPNPATAEWLTDLLGRYLRRSPDLETVLGGLHLGWFAGRRVLPGASAVLTATGLLGEHWVTGRLAAEDSHLGSLLRLVDPAHPTDPMPAGPVSDPLWDGDVLADVLGRAAELRPVAEAALAGAWRDTWHTLDTLRARLPEIAGHVDERWERDRWSFTSHRNRVEEGTAAFAARLRGVPAYRFLHELETRTAALERQLALDDPLIMERYIVSGEALAGTVTKVDREHTITAASGRELLRPRIWVATPTEFTRPLGTELWLAADPKLMAVVESIEPESVELVVQKGAVQRAQLGRLPATGAEVVFAPFGSEDIFPSRLPEELPWQFGTPDE
ncbi:hypothetical protein F4553_005063 [Allocatelliglobosispora scoriae]|uniref:Uncharacterized protein n=1 Tax=Allocatelliglobosispora scoriae TaxID=643052 RepID=A0A841BU03_9ACTN|nr:hypothetical protein [Allocatelliglobosispora scoriae]MBB5871684.1 hypothetical protein [Allocatelliglobosispora scoriae]